MSENKVLVGFLFINSKKLFPKPVLYPCRSHPIITRKFSSRAVDKCRSKHCKKKKIQYKNCQKELNKSTHLKTFMILPYFNEILLLQFNVNLHSGYCEVKL